ncbi:hypothetical protein RJ639_016422 [Escallonia herrerae]|uniref:Uncharacterized protein n=1 Tax=Escallonia herrerae TaxID=1293975 RepID=A0AA89AJW8_9ASTE|nr:hypothetical protein RJ639_016422 [Escallonia herrerae]
METPSSTRRVTRSQALAAVSGGSNLPMSRKFEESEKGVSKSRQQNGKQKERSALIDITNDSPIVGLAMGSLGTPSSTLSKKRHDNLGKHNSSSNTPGSGEALLRGQVKTLLQKVEEEAEISKLSLERRPVFHIHGGLASSPMGLLAPTPANTPQLLNLYDDLAPVTPSPSEDKIVISQMVIVDGEKQESLETEKSVITRLDFSEKSEGSDSSDCTSVLSYFGGGSEGREKSCTDDDDASVWSIQVNASTKDEEEEEEAGDEVCIEEVEEEPHDEDEEADDRGWVDELCDGISKISVNGELKMARFAGKHTRFVYNSDDEVEEEVEDLSSAVSPGILCLKGLPTPIGKHLRFSEEPAEED